MHEYQKRSSSPNLAALQAYQRKLAANGASSSGGGQEEEPLPKINRDLMYKAYQMRLSQFFPSQQVQQEKENDSASSKAQADVAETTDEGQDVQGKGNWQQKADTNAIFSNGSALSSGLMAKYENLMPGVSLGHVSLHQGSQVDAALQTAGLHGLTDGTNVAVASTAPAGTLEHEIGHVAQRQEQGFSLNEGNRLSHETDADSIAAKLSNNQPVERFGQTVNSPGLAARLQLKAIAMTQAKCSQCEDNQPGFVQQLMAKSLAAQSGGQAQVTGEGVKIGSPIQYKSIGEILQLSSYLQAQPTMPGGGGPNPNCLRLLGEILSFLYGGLNNTIGETTLTGTQVSRGVIERWHDMYNDGADPNRVSLYRNHRTSLGQPEHPIMGSWEGHRTSYNNTRIGLVARLRDWANNRCDDHNNSSGLPERWRNVIAEARKWGNTAPPKKPGNVQKISTQPPLPLFPNIIPRFVLERVANRLSTGELWGRFWKVVIRRFAIRVPAAAALSAADGPLPVGEIISLGLAFWTLWDIYRLWDNIWGEAITQV